MSVAVEAARLLTDFLTRGQVRFAVNMPALDKAELDDVPLYLNLAWRLGMLHSQMNRGTLKNAKITFRGEVAHKNTKLITASFAAGLMETALEQQVNLVNAIPLARERGIVIEEGSAEAPADFATLIQTEVTTERKAYAASGTLFGKQFLRLVRLGDYLLDAHMDGTLLIFTHLDRPGLIGFIGRTLGDEGVNIAQMNVGRAQQGGEAIGVVNLDSVPSAQALENLRQNAHILSLSVIKLPPWRRPALAGDVSALETVQEQGLTFLDKTIVLFGSNLGNANAHDTRNLPILLADGGFKHGRHVWPDTVILSAVSDSAHSFDQGAGPNAQLDPTGDHDRRRRRLGPAVARRRARRDGRSARGARQCEGEPRSHLGRLAARAPFVSLVGPPRRSRHALERTRPRGRIHRRPVPPRRARADRPGRFLPDSRLEVFGSRSR